MKSEKKLQQAVALLKAVDDVRANEAIDLIVDFLIDNITPSKTELRCKDFISKDQFRPTLRLIFHDNEHKTAVATDAHALFSNEAEYVETDGKGLRDIIGNPQPDAGVFPNWSKVLPKHTKPTTIEPDLEAIYKKAMAEAKANGHNDKGKVFILVNGVQWMNAKHVELMLKAGLDGWTVSTDSPTSSSNTLFKQWDGKQLLLMPVYVEEPTEAELKRKFRYIEK